ncbi:unnamed protein product, partial [Meganyctiphanes norvegica]
MLLQLHNSKFYSHKLLPNIIDPTNAYNVDETGFCFNKLPTRSYVSDNNIRGGFKQNKTRLSLLSGGNMAGERLKPLVIGKAKRPRAFGSRDITSLPVYYEAQDNAWVSSQIFWHWFLEHFIVEMEQRYGPDFYVYLILDNC